MIEGEAAYQAPERVWCLRQKVVDIEDGDGLARFENMSRTERTIGIKRVSINQPKRTENCVEDKVLKVRGGY